MEDQDLINFTEVRPAGLHILKLSVFWVDKPDSWFLLAKGRFAYTASTENRLGMSTWCRPLPRRLPKSFFVLDVVEHPPEHHLFTALKQSLLDSNLLPDYQKITAFHKMKPPVGRKPMQLLASMVHTVKLCPQGSRPASSSHICF
jgi:hypothetical protein